ncbi:MAG: 4-oxalocrotonate tautomerase family protein [Chloroflexi bacterium]|nr:4-oxalocrotonate tautomerase family protein [Chloroflexota bacterium]
MPFVNIKMWKGQSQERKQRIAHRITEVLTEETGAPREVVTIIFEDIPPNQWASGGKLAEGETA